MTIQRLALKLEVAFALQDGNVELHTLQVEIARCIELRYLEA